MRGYAHEPFGVRRALNWRERRGADVCLRAAALVQSTQEEIMPNMKRVSGIAGALVVALALAPISAQGQQISACVNNSSGTIHIAATVE
jgi:hypothetical protein